MLSKNQRNSVSHSIAVLTDYNKGGPKCKDHPDEDTAYVCMDPSCPDNKRLLLYCQMCLMVNRVHRSHCHESKKGVNEEILELYTALKAQIEQLKNEADKMYTELGPLIRYLDDMMPPGNSHRPVPASIALLRALELLI